ncbi:MAG: S24 family peptidase [Crocinitomicaceae bacterium]|jgi:phage repressor protein C with HTH and peptisase S24 domain|nr:S24 family peptidase [Crocinitomicaceae bacterium]
MNTDINHRINYLADKLFEGNNSKFAKEMGTSEANIRNYRTKTIPKLEFIQQLHTKFEISYEWLLEGSGSEQNTMNMVNESVSEYGLRTDSKIENQEIPLYEYHAAAGLVALFRDHSEQEKVGKISVPNLPKCDGAIYITGDSMYPLLKSGDIIMYKQYQDFRDGIVFYGEMYLVAFTVEDSDHVTVKWLHKSDRGPAFIKLVSENKHHEPVDIPRSSITAMAMVKASIRINSMI